MSKVQVLPSAPAYMYVLPFFAKLVDVPSVKSDGIHTERPAQLYELGVRIGKRDVVKPITQHQYGWDSLWLKQYR